MKNKKMPVTKEEDHGIQMLGVGTVKANGEHLVIEGLANKNVVDRGNDIIDIDAWELDNFKKNPVILFNHGMDPTLGGTPIGKAIEIKPTKDGLMIKAQLSSIDDPVINRIRGLVKERILRAFSVGFDPKLMDKDQESGANRIKKAELFEVSIVGVPMNQDSLFNITGKMMARKSVNLLKREILKKKGAHLASALHAKILEHKKNGEERSSLLSKVEEMTGLSNDELLDILAGNVESVAEEVLEAFSEVLGIQLSELKELADTKEEETEQEESEDTESVDTEEEEENDEDEEESEVSNKQADQPDVAKNDSTIGAANSESDNNNFGSPYLDEIRQTNVLLGVLINEMQINNAKLDGIAKNEKVEEEEDVEQITEEVAEEEVQKEVESEEVKEVEDDDDTDEEEMEKQKKAIESRIDRYVKKLENVKKRLKDLED